MTAAWSVSGTTDFVAAGAVDTTGATTASTVVSTAAVVATVRLRHLSDGARYAMTAARESGG
jgi:hypothetical protein